DSGKAEDLIKKAVVNDAGAKIKSVDCPGDKTAKKGGTFTCQVTGADGTKGSALVTMTSDDGKVRVSAPFVHPREAESQIAKGIKDQAKLKAIAVTCPEIIVGKAGATFTCKAVGDGQKADVLVTQTNGTGGFTYKVRNSAGG
ncbi:MAG: hypothetical protein JWM31_720, partial [Solirubrobacterales bacterium]|nr:hypothetical protein [Solirubrobacterales bacterium]